MAFSNLLSFPCCWTHYCNVDFYWVLYIVCGRSFNGVLLLVSAVLHVGDTQQIFTCRLTWEAFPRTAVLHMYLSYHMSSTRGQMPIECFVNSGFGVWPQWSVMNLWTLCHRWIHCRKWLDSCFYYLMVVFSLHKSYLSSLHKSYVSNMYLFVGVRKLVSGDLVPPHWSRRPALWLVVSCRMQVNEQVTWLSVAGGGGGVGGLVDTGSAACSPGSIHSAYSGKSPRMGYDLWLIKSFVKTGTLSN